MIPKMAHQIQWCPPVTSHPTYPPWWKPQLSSAGMHGRWPQHGHSSHNHLPVGTSALRIWDLFSAHVIKLFSGVSTSFRGCCLVRGWKDSWHVGKREEMKITPANRLSRGIIAERHLSASIILSRFDNSMCPNVCLHACITPCACLV